MTSPLSRLSAVLHLSSEKKPGAIPLLLTPSGRLWLVLDKPEENLALVDWVAVTDNPADERTYTRSPAKLLCATGRLCALELSKPFHHVALPFAPPQGVVADATSALDLLEKIDSEQNAPEVLGHVLRQINGSVGEATDARALNRLLDSYKLAGLVARVSDPTKLVFERADVLVGDLEAHLRRTQLTILVGGANAGRSALASVLAAQSGNIRYVAGNNVSDTAAQVATDVEAGYATVATLHRSELVRFLTALILAVIQKTGQDVGERAFREANAKGAAEPLRAFAQYFVATLRNKLARGRPEEVLKEFFRLLSKLVSKAAGDDLTTVLLPFEKLEEEWRRQANPKLWAGLKALAYDLNKGPALGEGRLRILIMARSIPFNEIGDHGLRLLALAMPPLDEQEMRLRLAEFQGSSAAVDEKIAARALRLTGGIPVLTAALFHALPRTAAITEPALEAAQGQLENEFRRVCEGESVTTLSGRLLRQFVAEAQLEAGDDQYYLRFTGGDVYLDDDLGQPAFQRLFRSGLLWFTPRTKCCWSALLDGTEFRMASAPELLHGMLGRMIAPDAAMRKAL